MKVVRTGVQSRLLADFHELRQDFSPPEQANLTGEPNPDKVLHNMIWGLQAALLDPAEK